MRVNKQDWNNKTLSITKSLEDAGTVLSKWDKDNISSLAYLYCVNKFYFDKVKKDIK